MDPGGLAGRGARTEAARRGIIRRHGQRGERRIAVTGLGAVSAFGVGVGRPREGAWSGASAIAPVTLFDVSRFGAKTAAEVRSVPADPAGETDDRTEWLALAAAAEALAGRPFGGPANAEAGRRRDDARGPSTRGAAASRAGAPPLRGARLPARSRRSSRGDTARAARSPTVSTACASGTAAVGLGSGVDP